MDKQKIIIRREYNPYRKQWGYLVGFPEDPANSGNIGCVPCYFDGYGNLVCEPYCEADKFYFRKKKLVHKNEEDAEKVKSELEKRYDEEFVVAEKIMKGCVCYD